MKGGTRKYRTVADRKKAVDLLMKRGFNYFVGFKDADKERPAGLSYGVAEWAGGVHTKDLGALIH